MTKRPRIWHDGASGQKMANYEVDLRLQGDQGQAGVPQVPLLGHGDEVESTLWACRDYWTGHGQS